MEIWEASHPGPAPGLTGTPQHPVEPSFLPVCSPTPLPWPCPRPLDSVCLRPAGVGRPRVLTPQTDRPSGWDKTQVLHQPCRRAGCRKGWGGASSGPGVRGVLGLLKLRKPWAVFKELVTLEGQSSVRGAPQ